ncbi:hypothetical protein [Candidatus Palauibacter sp.]|uniref:hypothetical protein n=1 Tax=Candidatus Palauibacter sp. TaxID=3101350 RepID=UPI003AF26EA0
MRPDPSSEPPAVDALRMSPDAMLDLQRRLSFEGNRQGMAQDSGPMHGAVFGLSMNW